MSYKNETGVGLDVAIVEGDEVGRELFELRIH